MGFGLFVPEFREEFAMSSAAVGFVSALGFVGFFLALLLAQALLQRRGPEVPVLTGLVAATLGLGIVALAPNLPVLALGVFLAASSAGFAWTPFNDAVHRKINEVDRPTALSRISTGTAVGIAAAGLAALVMVMAGLSWRICWGFFAAAAAVALLANWAALRDVDRAPAPAGRQAWRDLLRIGTVPLVAVAFVYGTISAIYISFTADHMLARGGAPGLPSAAAPALIFVFFGLFGLAGLLTGRVKQQIGLPWLLRLLMLAGAGSVALAAVGPGNWAALIASAGLQGVHVMMTSAVLAFWSERLFPALPSLSFTAALLATATGSVLGPAVAGLVAEAHGMPAMFLGAAVLPVLLALMLRDRHGAERPLQPAMAQLG